MGFIRDYVPDERLILMLKRHEGFRQKPYLDTVGKTTVAFGRNLEDVGISESEAGILLQNDIDRAAIGLLDRMPWFADLDEVRQAALIDMAFNMGIAGLLTFNNMLGNLALRNWEGAAAEALNSKWAKQVGSRSKEIAEMLRTGKWAK